jgi:hypothetical protein
MATRARLGSVRMRNPAGAYDGPTLGLLLLVAFEIAVTGGLRTYFKRHHGG